MYVIVRARHDEGEIQIAQIVEYRAAAGGAPGQLAALVLQQLHPALLPGILVATDHHRVLVLPEIEDHLVRLEPFEQQRLHGQVVPGIVGIPVDDAVFHVSASESIFGYYSAFRNYAQGKMMWSIAFWAAFWYIVVWKNWG